MTLPTASQEAAEQALLERRRERTNALRACRPHERFFLRQLPKSRYAPYTAGQALGLSSRTVMKMLNRPRVRRAMEIFLADALDEIGVSHASLVADLVEVKQRCMQQQAVLDKDGKPTGEFQFDSRGAIAAIKEIAELLKLTPAKRIELTTKDGKELPAPVFNISFADGGPGDYGIEVSGAPGSDVPGSDALN